MAAIRAAGAGQGDVITRIQLVDIGISPRRILRWVTDGTLFEVARGVYSLDRRVTPLGERWAAHLSVGAHASLAGASALAALDVINTPRKPVHLLVPTRPPRPQPGVVVHESGNLHTDDLLLLDGLSCTSFARTALHAARPSEPGKLDRILDRGVQLRLFDAAAIEALLHRQRSSPATRALEAAVGRLDATAGNNRTELERLVMALVRDSHLPPAVNNARMGGFEVDVWFPGTRAIVEADGDRFHSTPAQIATDIAKRKALARFGFAVMRVNWTEANYATDRTIDRIDRFLQANLQPPVPGPPADLDLSTRGFGR